RPFVEVGGDVERGCWPCCSMPRLFSSESIPELSLIIPRSRQTRSLPCAQNETPVILARRLRGLRPFVSSIRTSAVQRCHAPLGGARHALRRAAPPCGPPPGVVPRRAGRDEAAFGPPAPQGRDEARLAPVERPPLLATVTRHR